MCLGVLLVMIVLMMVMMLDDVFGLSWFSWNPCPIKSQVSMFLHCAPFFATLATAFVSFVICHPLARWTKQLRRLRRSRVVPQSSRRPE